MIYISTGIINVSLYTTSAHSLLHLSLCDICWISFCVLLLIDWFQVFSHLQERSMQSYIHVARLQAEGITGLKS